MPAVSSPFAESWNETAAAVLKTIKRRGITFRAFAREIGEDDNYARLHAGIRYSRPPSGADGEKRAKKVAAWLAKHAR